VWFCQRCIAKISDAPLTDCPSCGKASFKKQVTAAGFQLKGSGWYVTDFRGGSGGTSATGGATATASACRTCLRCSGLQQQAAAQQDIDLIVVNDATTETLT
jgi:putative FmdB family regulatory protein